MNRRDGALALAALAAIVASWPLLVFAIARRHADGYSLDIYAEAGTLFWVGAAANVLGTALWTVAAPGRSRAVYLNLAALFVLIVDLPSALGYFAYGRADALTIIGSINGVATRGHVSSQNIYPATDILAATTVHATGLPANAAFQDLAIASSLLILAVLALLVRRSVPAGAFHPILHMAAFVFYFGWIQTSGIPNFVALGVLALAIYLLVRGTADPLPLRACLFLLSAAIVIGHPFVSAFLLVGLALGALYFRRQGTKKLHIQLAVALFMLGAWLSFNVGLTGALAQNWRAFLLKLTQTVAIDAASKVESLGLGPSQLLQFAFYYLGRYFIPFLVILLAVRELRLTRRTGWTWATGLVLVGGVTQLLLLFNPIVAHNIIRVSNINYPVFGLVPLFVLAVAKLAARGPAWRAAAFAAVPLVLIVSMLGMYDSPRTFLPSQEFDGKEVAAAKWVLTERAADPIYNPLGAFEYRSLTLLEDVQPQDNPLRAADSGILPDHFGWPGPVAPRPGYVALPQNDVVRYPEVYPKLGRFTYGDFGMLETRAELARVYDIPGFTTYFQSEPTAVR